VTTGKELCAAYTSICTLAATTFTCCAVTLTAQLIEAPFVLIEARQEVLAVRTTSAGKVSKICPPLAPVSRETLRVICSWYCVITPTRVSARDSCTVLAFCSALLLYPLNKVEAPC
jgi:hypothetical protein